MGWEGEGPASNDGWEGEGPTKSASSGWEGEGATGVSIPRVQTHPNPNKGLGPIFPKKKVNEAPIAPIKTSTMEDLQQSPIYQRSVGAALDVADLIGSGVGMLGDYGARYDAFKAGLPASKGRELGETFRDSASFRSAYDVSDDYKPNPAVAKTFETLGDTAKYLAHNRDIQNVLKNKLDLPKTEWDKLQDQLVEDAIMVLGPIPFLKMLPKGSKLSPEAAGKLKDLQDAIDRNRAESSNLDVGNYDKSPAAPTGKQPIPTVSEVEPYPEISAGFKQLTDERPVTEGPAAQGFAPDKGGFPEVDRRTTQFPEKETGTEPYPEVDRAPYEVGPFDNPWPNELKQEHPQNNPFIQNAVDHETAQRQPDVGAHSQMDMQVNDPNAPWWPNKDLERRIAMANRDAEGTMPKREPNVGPESPYPDISHLSERVADASERPNQSARNSRGEPIADDFSKNAQAVNELHKVTNGAELVAFIRKHGNDPTLNALLDKIEKRGNLADVVVQITGRDEFKNKPNMLKDLTEGDSLASHGPNANGVQTIGIRGIDQLAKGRDSGFQYTSLTHEIGHAVTDRAIELGDKAGPEYAAHRAFKKELTDLYEEAKRRKGAEEFPAELGDIKEFNAYGWTDPKFREWLSKPGEGGSLMDRLKRTWAKLFGTTKSMLDKLDAMRDKTPERGADTQAYADKVYGDRNQAVTAQEVKDKFPLEKMKDLTVADRNMPMTENQRAKWTGNPVIEFAYNKMREIYGDAMARDNGYKAHLAEFKKYIKTSKDSALKIINTLVNIQDPMFMRERTAAERMNAREAFLESRGLNPIEVRHAITILDVMKHIGEADTKSAKAYYGRDIQHQPMYFPLVHGGIHTLIVTDPVGKVVYSKGFDSQQIAREWEQKVRAQSPADHTVNLTQNAPNNLGDVYNNIIMAATKIPDFLVGINEALLKQQELAKRKFELERAANKVGGAVGETIYSDRANGWQNTKTLELIDKRIAASSSFETKGRVLKEIREPFLEDPAMEKLPNLNRYLQGFTGRELGFNLSVIHPAELAVDRFVESTGKSIDKLAGELRGYKGGDISYWNPNLVRRLAQNWVGFTSLWSLGLKPSVWLGNVTAATPLIIMDGMRRGRYEGNHEGLAALAYMRMLLPHEGAEIFMKQAKLDGMIDPKISDPLHATQEKDPLAKRIIDAPRNAIEWATNRVAMRYYYEYYRMTRPELHELGWEFKNKVYQAARDWTGDYSTYAQPMQVSQLGVIGTMQSNFGKWRWNQNGRLMNDIKESKGGNLLPLLYTIGTATAFAGMMGAPLLQEYDTVQKGLKWISNNKVDLKPYATMLYDTSDAIRKEYGDKWGDFSKVWIRGPANEAIDSVSQELGMKSGPDLGSTMRYSSLLDANTVAFKLMHDVFIDGLPTFAKKVWKAMGNGDGTTRQEDKDAFNMAPAAIKPILRQEYSKIRKENGEIVGYVKQFPNQDKGSYVQSPGEARMEALGFKSMREEETEDRAYGNEWKKRDIKKTISHDLALWINNVDRPDKVKEFAKEIYTLGGKQAFDAAIDVLTKKNPMETSTAYFDRETLAALRNQDPIVKARLLNQIKIVQESQRTSSGR